MSGALAQPATARPIRADAWLPRTRLLIGRRRRLHVCVTIPRGAWRCWTAPTAARSVARHGICRSGGRRCRSCDGRPSGGFSAHLIATRRGVRGGERSTIACSWMAARPWPGGAACRAIARHRRSSCGCRSSLVPTGRSWYRAHNASIVSAYLENRDLAELESMPERFFLNVALLRVLYAHALSAAPRLALGRFAPLGRVLGDPRLGWLGRSCRSGACFRIATRSEDDLEVYLARRARSGADAGLRRDRAAAPGAL